MEAASRRRRGTRLGLHGMQRARVRRLAPRGRGTSSFTADRRGIRSSRESAAGLRRDVGRDALTEAPEEEDLAVDDAARAVCSLLNLASRLAASPDRAIGRVGFAALQPPADD